MRLSKVSFICLLICFLTASLHAAETRIIKVLPHYLDAKGRNSLSPSLYERDAYQVYLRDHPEQRSALRFDVQWKGKAKSELKIKIEIRTSQGESIQQISKEAAVRKTGWFSNWAAVKWEGEDYNKIGQVLAWRATLWDVEKQLAEKKSFLW